MKKQKIKNKGPRLMLASLLDFFTMSCLLKKYSNQKELMNPFRQREGQFCLTIIFLP